MVSSDVEELLCYIIKHLLQQSKQTSTPFFCQSEYQAPLISLQVQYGKYHCHQFRLRIFKRKFISQGSEAYTLRSYFYYRYNREYVGLFGRLSTAEASHINKLLYRELGSGRSCRTNIVHTIRCYGSRKQLCLAIRKVSLSHHLSYNDNVHFRLGGNSHCDRL